VAAGLPAERRALSADPTHPVVSAGAIFWGLGAAALDLIQSTFFATATYASRGACLERQTPGADSTGRCNGLVKSLSRCVEV
jgi:hypothetical protein